MRRNTKQKAIVSAPVVAPAMQDHFVVDPPIVTTTLRVTGENRTSHADQFTTHDVSIELEIYEGAGKDPLVDDVFLSLTRHRGLSTRGLSGESRSPDRVIAELNIHELEPLVAALGSIVEAAKQRGFLSGELTR